VVAVAAGAAAAAAGANHDSSMLVQACNCCCRQPHKQDTIHVTIGCTMLPVAVVISRLAVAPTHLTTTGVPFRKQCDTADVQMPLSVHVSRPPHA
jgi:hypothetical protein